MAKRSLEIKREYERQEEYETEDEVGESEDDDETVDYGGGGDGVEEEEEEQEEREEEVEDRRKRALIRIVSGQRRGVPSNTLCCQADDCGVDLRAAKRYHRRHKVCERHAKAAFVFLGGIEQRFCQQCSRFHEISQFDDTKRSCRKRLAGHNQRRRKNQPDPPHTEDRRKPPNSKMNASSLKATEHSDYNELSFRGQSNIRHFRIR